MRKEQPLYKVGDMLYLIEDNQIKKMQCLAVKQIKVDYAFHTAKEHHYWLWSDWGSEYDIGEIHRRPESKLFLTKEDLLKAI